LRCSCFPAPRPEEIEQYGIRVAEQWKLGRKGVDDGLILIVAKDDQAQSRIEVGYAAWRARYPT
jgi:uncharacterized protein